MPTPPHLILPPAGSTPAQREGPRRGPRAMPPDLLREASLRLGIMSLLGAALWTLGTGLGHVALWVARPAGDPTWLVLTPLDAIGAASVVISLVLFAYTRRGDQDPARTLDLGLAYMILTAFALGFMFHLDVALQSDGTSAARSIRPEISWIGAVVLMFAAIIPATPTKMSIAGLIAVSMNPVTMLIVRAQGHWDFGPAASVLLMHYPDYLLLGVAVVISRVVTQLGRQVTRAREMGSYHVGELLGRGGMGEVYLATHRMLARPAAIKLIRPESLGVGNGEGARLAVKRFTREAEAAANLRSPHTVEVYDFGVTDDQTLYYVMELLDGMDLESLIGRHGALPAARVIHILRQVCESLEEAHVRGLVHRDIKPANIHVGRVALRHDFVKVLDFGLVKAVTKSVDGDSLATATGLVPGTPAYMAPEMVRGESVDGRADIYALGCVAYYMLTGRLVFEATNPIQMIMKHVEAPPDPPSLRATLPVPPALDAAVLACLAKDPGERMQSAAALDRSLVVAEGEAGAWTEAQAAAWWSAAQR